MNEMLKIKATRLYLSNIETQLCQIFFNTTHFISGMSTCSNFRCVTKKGLCRGKWQPFDRFYVFLRPIHKPVPIFRALLSNIIFYIVLSYRLGRYFQQYTKWFWGLESETTNWYWYHFNYVLWWIYVKVILTKDTKSIQLLVIIKTNYLVMECLMMVNR